MLLSGSQAHAQFYSALVVLAPWLPWFLSVHGDIVKIAKVVVQRYPVCGLSPMEIYGGLGGIICKENVSFGVCGGEHRPRHEATANDAYRLTTSTGKPSCLPNH